MKQYKKLELGEILKLIKSGYSPSKIVKEFSIPKGTLAYHVGKLKRLGCIEYRGYATWEYIKPLKEVRNRPKGSMKPQNSNFPNLKEIRGHAFIWKIEFIEPYNWSKVVNLYKKKKLSFSLICNNKVPRTIFNSRKIWLTKRGFTIYEPLDFMGCSSFQVKGNAVFEMDLLIKSLLKELNLKFKPYRFTTSREHYGIMKNELARQYNDKKEKMNIRSEDGTIWLWIDDSKGLGELETKDPSINRQVQNFWNSHKKHKFKVDPEFILENFKESAKQIKQNADNQDYHAENMRSHVGATRDLSTAAELLNKNLETQNQNLEKQTKIFEKIEFLLNNKL